MKNIILLLITIFTLNSCEDNNNKPKTELEKLPAATMTGANTVGCLVNGQAMIPKGYVNTSNCFYEDGLNFGLGFSMEKNNEDKVIVIGCSNKTLEVGRTYQLKENGKNSQYGEYSIDSVSPPNPNYYSTTSSVTGELKITKHDFDHAFLSGTFWFDAVNSNGEKVEIREGRFDMHY